MIKKKGGLTTPSSEYLNKLVFSIRNQSRGPRPSSFLRAILMRS